MAMQLQPAALLGYGNTLLDFSCHGSSPTALRCHVVRELKLAYMKILHREALRLYEEKTI